MYVSEICAEGIFCNFSLVTKNVKNRSKIAPFQMSAILKWFPKKKTITFFWSKNYLNYTKRPNFACGNLQFTSPLEFNAIFRDGFTLRHELTAGSEIRDPVPAKFKHVTNIVTCTCTMLWLRHVHAGTEISKKLTSNPRLSAKNTPLFLFPQMGHSLQIFV